MKKNKKNNTRKLSHLFNKYLKKNKELKPLSLKDILLNTN